MNKGNNMDVDNNGHEYEELGKVQRNDPQVFYRCKTPIAMEVWDINNNQTYVDSKNFNSDGLPKAEKFNSS